MLLLSLGNSSRSSSSRGAEALLPLSSRVRMRGTSSSMLTAMPSLPRLLLTELHTTLLAAPWEALLSEAVPGQSSPGAVSWTIGHSSASTHLRTPRLRAGPSRSLPKSGAGHGSRWICAGAQLTTRGWGCLSRPAHGSQDSGDGGKMDPGQTAEPGQREQRPCRTRGRHGAKCPGHTWLCPPPCPHRGGGGRLESAHIKLPEGSF